MWSDVEQLKTFKTELLKKAEDRSFEQDELTLQDLIDPEEPYKLYDESELVLFTIFTQIMTLASSIQLRIQYLEKREIEIQRVPNEEAETDKIWD